MVMHEDDELGSHTRGGLRHMFSGVSYAPLWARLGLIRARGKSSEAKWNSAGTKKSVWGFVSLDRICVNLNPRDLRGYFQRVGDGLVAREWRVLTCHGPQITLLSLGSTRDLPRTIV